MSSLISPVKNVDWAVLVRRVLRDAQCTNKELGEATGITPNHISKVKREYQALHATPDQTMALLMVYIANTSKTVPIVGQYFEDEPIDQ
jgi:hypothetical protein